MNTQNWTPVPVLTTKSPGANLDALTDKKLAVIGFGSQGHAHALNLKDRGFDVIIGLRPESKSVTVAEGHGFTVCTPFDAVRFADVILIAVPDMYQAKLFREEILPGLQDGDDNQRKTILFSHGLAVHFGLVEIPSSVAVAMVAPKGPGHLVRAQALKKPQEGTPALIAVHQDPHGDARAIALSWAHGIGATLAGVLETTFQEETETDLFGEQTVLCGGVAQLVRSGFEVLVEAGYAPEMAYFEVLHELKLTVDLMNQRGIGGMYFSVSETAKWGGLSVGSEIVNDRVKQRMRLALSNIRDGTFIKGWVSEYEAGLPNYTRLLQETNEEPLAKVGDHLRSLMPWLPKVNTGGAQAGATFTA